MKRLVTLLSAAFLLVLPLQAADLGGKVVQIGTDPTYPPHEYIDAVSYTHLTLPTICSV